MKQTYELEPFLGSPRPVELVSELLEHRLEGSSLVLRCATEHHEPELQDYYGTRVETVFVAPARGRDATIRIDACTPEILRVRCAPGDEVPENATPMVVGDVSARAPVTLHEDEATVRLDTGSVTCVIEREPFRLRILDAAREILLETRPVDLDSLRRPEERWNPTEQRWIFSLRYAYPLGWTDHGDRTAAFASFGLHHEEAVYGLGEDFGPMDKRGTSQRLWLQEAFSNTSRAAYKQCPFLLSTRGYGVFANTSNAVRVDVGSRDHTATSLTVEDTAALDLFVIAGPRLADILPRYTAITGAPALPPRWSFGFWMARISYESQDEVETVARELREHRIPCDVIHIDTAWFEKNYTCDLRWAPERFPDPAGMCARLAQLGFRVSLWQWPNYGVGSPLFIEGQEAGYLAKRTSGHTYTFAGGYGEDAGFVDWSNPASVEHLAPKFAALFDAGVAAIKVDYGEGAPPEAVYHAERSEEMHNRYPLLYGKAIWEMTEAAHGTQDTVLWARAAWAGSQRYPVHWSGDGVARFEDLACVVRAALSFGLSGFPFYSHDVGGFSGLPSPELYVRWAQLGVFSSHVRAHGTPPREPWAYGERAEAIVREALELRYRLLPYLYSEAVDCCERSLPMVRPLVLEHQEDPVTHGLDDQYGFGSALLVAPVLDEREHRRVYLPAGGWFDYWTKERLEGPAWIDAVAPLDRIPLYARECGVLPMGDLAQHTGEATLDPLRIELYGIPAVASYAVHGGEGQVVTLRFEPGPGGLRVSADGIAGRTEIAAHGVAVQSARAGEAELELRTEGAATVVELPADGTAVELSLAP